MSFPMSQLSGSDTAPKVPIPRDQSRRHHQPPRRNRQVNRDRVPVACASCRLRKVRCDGRQPTCRNCDNLEPPCVYPAGRKNRFKSATMQNRAMAQLLMQLRDSVADRNRQQIDDLLAEVTEDVADAAATLRLDRSPATDDTHGEFTTSGEVGSNDETDVIDEDLLRDKDSQATGYVGKSSEVQWLRRLQHESERRRRTSSTPSSPHGPSGDSFENAKQRIEAFREWQRHKPSIPTSSSTFYLDSEGVEVDCNVDPYTLPNIEVAQRLVDRYVSTVQDIFPVLVKVTFKQQVRHYLDAINRGAPYYVPEEWLVRLNLVFAIGSRFSDLTEADWQSNSRDHIIYQSRAHMLNLNEPSLVHQPDLAQVQITALFAFYASTVGNVNRAWVAVGISIRYALALGLHLRNEDQTINIVKKEGLVQIWWALQILEGSLSIMLGRPSLVVEDFYSTPLPLPASMEQLTDGKMAFYWNNYGGRGRFHNDNAAGADLPTFEPCNAGSFLRCLATLSKIGQGTLTGLYSARLMSKSWKDTQRTMAGLWDELEMWAANLPPGLNFTQPTVGGGFLREGFILQMSYIRVKILITRPCLCRLDDRIPEQTKDSSSFNNKMARNCVSAAKTLTDILPVHASAAYLYQIGPWWSMTHHLMQALTVLLLELSYNAVHDPPSEEILPKVKKLIRWLRVLKRNNRVARRAHDLGFGVLQNLASQVDLDIDISDLMQEDAPSPARSNSQSSSAPGVRDHFQQSFTGVSNYDSGMSHQSMSAFPPRTYQGGLQVPEAASSATNLPLGLETPSTSFGNAFSTLHDERDHIFSHFPT